MINGNLEQFLDTGWFTDATLFLNGYIYWCESRFDENAKVSNFCVDKWKVQNEDNKYFHSILNSNGTLDWTRIYEDSYSDIELIKKRFLEATIFDGKTFWQVESELAWLDEAEPILKESD